MKLSIDLIRLDGGTQPRSAVDPDVIDAYEISMREGAKFPPVDIFFDGESYWLADGFHRLRATRQTAADEIDATIHQGTQADAQWFSFGANKTNGLYRSNADKQRAVQSALKHEKSAGMSDNALADHCGVDRKTVLSWRERLALTCGNSQVKTRTGKDGRTINTANIGRKPAEKSAPAAQPFTVADVIGKLGTLSSSQGRPVTPLTVVRKTEPVKPATVNLDMQSEADAICEAIRVIFDRKITARDFSRLIVGSGWDEAVVEVCEFLQSTSVNLKEVLA